MVERLVALWRRVNRASYPPAMGIARRGTPQPAEPPADLARFYGLWVAVRDGKVLAAAETPKQLVYEMSKLSPSDRREAVMQKAHPPTGAVVIGMG